MTKQSNFLVVVTRGGGKKINSHRNLDSHFLRFKMDLQILKTDL